MIMFTIPSTYRDSGYNSPCSPSTSTSFDTPVRAQRFAAAIRQKLDFSSSWSVSTVSVATQTVYLDPICKRIANRLSQLSDEFDQEYFQPIEKECSNDSIISILENVIKLLLF